MKCASFILANPNFTFHIARMLRRLPVHTQATFYGSSAGAEIDLVLETGNNGVYAIEIKRTLSPTISKGFRLACQEINPKQRFYVIPTTVSFALDKETTAIGIEELITALS